MNNVRKSVQIQTKSANGKFVYKPYPSNELKNNYKLMAVSSISLTSESPINTVLTISSNFVKSERFDLNSQVISYELPLQSFAVKTNNNLVFQQFGLTWFPLNSASEELIFTLRDFENKTLAIKINATLTVYFA